MLYLTLAIISNITAIHQSTTQAIKAFPTIGRWGFAAAKQVVFWTDLNTILGTNEDGEIKMDTWDAE